MKWYRRERYLEENYTESKFDSRVEREGILIDFDFATM